MYLAIGLLVPFAGTTLGAACVFFMKNQLNRSVQKGLLGFASGVMTAASVWSLLIPAIEMAEERLGRFSFFPASVGFTVGILFLLFTDKMIPHLYLNEGRSGGRMSGLKKTTMLVLAVTLHNIPEGMAVGVAFAGVLSGQGGIAMAAALALAVGIAVQNFPEGAIISLPLKGEGKSKKRAFLFGMASGAVEPAAAVITLLLTGIVLPLLPYLLAFAAGAMIYVVVEELLPEASEGEYSDIGTLGFAAGFLLMMILDVTLG